MIFPLATRREIWYNTCPNMTRKSKYYFTAPMIKRINVWRAIETIVAIAAREGATLDKLAMLHALRTPDQLVDFIQQLDTPLRDAVNREFRNIKRISRVPRIKSTILQVLAALPGSKSGREELEKTLNNHDLAYIGATLCATLPTDAWREICTMAKHLQAPPSAWLSFTVEAHPGARLALNDEVQAAFRKEICGFIFANEGRADEGWCTYTYDQAEDKHCFEVNMTDHLGEAKEHVGHNQFAVMRKKAVFDILFRYKPALRELSILAEGPRNYRMAMCLFWIKHFLAGEAELHDTFHRFRLERFLDAGENLAVAAQSPVTKAEVVAVIIGSRVYEAQEYRLTAGRGDLRQTIAGLCKLVDLSRGELAVKKLELRFHYLNGRGEAAYADLYIRPDTSNLVRAPDRIRNHIMPILAENGYCNE